MKRIQPLLPEELQVTECGIKFLLEGKEQEERISGRTFRDIAAEGEELSQLVVSATKFQNCRFFDCCFERSEFTDVVFQSCDFSGCNLSDGFFNRVAFLGCKGVGTKFMGSSMRNLTITECNLNYANFDASKLENIQIEDTELTSSNMTQCKCKQVTWRRVQLTNASFFKTSLYGMDFTDSTITGLVLSDGNEELKGAVVDLFQAAELAKRMGLIIKS